MTWIPENSESGKELDPLWTYKDGIQFVTVLQNTFRVLGMLVKDLDPTRTWQHPERKWVHQWKVGRNMVTIFCTKYRGAACPFCYENEIFKLRNPNYKAVQQKLPYPLMAKGLLQVWDFQENQRVWLLSGKQINEGMDFIVLRQAEQYRGFVGITRMGRGLNTSYRVDLASNVDPNAVNGILQYIAGSMIPNDDNLDNYFSLSQEEITKRTGVNPGMYFQTKLNEGHNIDISDWGDVPTAQPISVQQQAAPQIHQGLPAGFGQGLPTGVNQASLPVSRPTTGLIPPANMGGPPLQPTGSNAGFVPPQYGAPLVGQQHNPAQQVQQPPQQQIMFEAPTQPLTPVSETKPMVEEPNKADMAGLANQSVDPIVFETMQQALDVVCTTGVFKDKKLKEAVDKAGKSYAQYLSKSGKAEENQAAQYLLNNWEMIDVATETITGTDKKSS